MNLRERLVARALASPTSAERPTPECGAPWGHRVDDDVACDPRARTGGGPRSVAIARVFARVPVPGAAHALAGLEQLVSRERRMACSAPPVFFDLETTGFRESVPFVVGIAALEDDVLCVRQLVLADPAGERSMWREAIAMLQSFGLGRAPLVTYNGATFDRPIVALRLRRLGLWTDAVARAFGALHVDLLPVARRLWRHRFADRRLSALERQLLLARREGDVGGAEVAAIGERWLAGPRTPELRRALDRVVLHNAFDLVGLAALYGRAVATCESASEPDQAVAVARHLVRIGRVEDARHRLATVLADPLPRTAIEAALALADLERTAGRLEDACRLWMRVCAVEPGHVRAAEALAKAYEHRLRRPDVALAWARSAASPCPQRVARLQRKLARTGDAADPVALPRTAPAV